MNQKFITKIEKIDNGKGHWDYLKVRIYETQNDLDKEIGSYIRNYSSFFHTFHPFIKEGKWFALYSREYTGTRIMSLPDCIDLGGEENTPYGFCPVDYYVPYNVKQVVEARKAGRFGFVAGCIWGDDSSWKIQHLDLSNIEKGKFTRTEKYGYIAMPNSIQRLSDCISFEEYDPSDDYNIINITTSIRYDLNSGEKKGMI